MLPIEYVGTTDAGQSQSSVVPQYSRFNCVTDAEGVFMTELTTKQES